MTNVLPAAFIVLATYALIALAKSIIPRFSTWPNNGIRAIGYVICYAMAAVNLMVQQTIHWQDLWGLLPVAGALFSTSALLYHIGADGPTAAPTVTQTPPLPAGPPALTSAAAPYSTGATAARPSRAPVSDSPDAAPVGPSVTDSSGPPAP